MHSKYDKDLETRAIEELIWEPIIDATNIRVTVSQGVVTLSGSVARYLEKALAVCAIKRLKNVRDVVEDIEVITPAILIPTDAEIKEAAWTTLRWHSKIPHDRMTLKVKQGHVTLDGAVQWQFQKEAAAAAVKYIIGVKGVSNFLFVKPEADSAVVMEDIERSLSRRADLHASSITVTTDSNTVTLKGTVGTWAAKRIAENASWSAPGVADVINELEVV
jgi:osmotically-inducible protein OsmY